MERIRVHPYPYYPGLRKTGEEYPEPETDIVFEYVTVDPEGKERVSNPLRTDLFHDRWHTVLRRAASGNYAYESTRESVLIESREVPGGKSRGSFSFRAPSWGSYRMVLTDPETLASTQVTFYAAGWGYSPWAIRNPARCCGGSFSPKTRRYGTNSVFF